MSKTVDEIYQEREDWILGKLTDTEKLIYNLSHLAEMIANCDLDAMEWLDDVIDAIDFIKGVISAKEVKQ